MKINKWHAIQSKSLYENSDKMILTNSFIITRGDITLTCSLQLFFMIANINFICKSPCAPIIQVLLTPKKKNNKQWWNNILEGQTVFSFVV